MSERHTELRKILLILEELKSAKEPKSKDKWDKAGIISQLVSGILLASFGLYVSWYIATSQETARQLSLDATNRQIAAEYLVKLTSAANPLDRAALLESADAALDPRYSVPLAVRFTRPVPIKVHICKREVRDRTDLKQNTVVNNAAIALLQRLKLKAPDARKNVSGSGYPPDAAIADFILGNRSRVLFRISDIDDFADVYINDKQISSYQFGHESGWIDVTDQLQPGQVNSLSVRIRNTKYEGTGVRVEVQAGAEQYDLVMHRGDWTGEGPAFGVGFSLSVDTRGLFHLNGYGIHLEGPVGEPHC